MESSTRKGHLIKPPLMTTMGEGAKSGEDYCCLIMNNSLNYLRHTNRSYPFNWHPNDTLLQSEHPIRISTTLSCCSSPLHGVLAINLLIPSLNTHPPPSTIFIWLKLVCLSSTSIYRPIRPTTPQITLR